MEYKCTKPGETSSHKPPISINGSWMLRITCLGLYNSLFIITEENNKFELYTYTFDEDDEFSFAQLKDGVAVVLGLSNISSQEP